jgi:hypothetical protein
MTITFSSCFYIIKSKFDARNYIEWMNNLISIVNNFNLVIYTDENSFKHINIKNNTKIKIIIKPLDKLYNYKYKDYWIKNHENNNLLNDKSCWELNMIWSEKIQFVKETAQNKYFDTDFYGWCDIGYFRNRPEDIHTNYLHNWGSNQSLLTNNINKICYACVNNDDGYMKLLYKLVTTRNENDLPVIPIPVHQVSIAGGFFILHRDNIEWWATTYDNKLKLYFDNNFLVKDDQIILVECILSNLDRFTLFRENINNIDNWFMFQRILNYTDRKEK